ncbi:MAG TPA: VWA domain-containing protein [Thermoanaerobaculia bacterium]|nr:VWA domain-containing protein [Thermoanaerobaculia bacterium]
MKSRAPLASFVGAVTLCLFGAAVAGQQPPADAPPAPEPTEVFVETVDVDVVDVPVVVTDDQGRPILGLTRDDFEVYEDGKRMELTNFYSVAHGQRLADAGEAGVPPLPGPGQPREQRLNLVVLIDSAHLAPGDRRRTLGHLADQLGAMLRPEDRVMLASVTPELKIVQPLSPELGPTVQSLGRLSRQAPAGVALELRRRQVLAIVNNDAATPTTDSGFGTQVARVEAARAALQHIRSFGAEADAFNRRTLVAIEDLVSSLAGLSGRKAVLYVSGGFDQRPAEPLYDFWERVFRDVMNDPSLGYSAAEFEANEWDLRHSLSRLVSTASANGVSFYAFDAGGFSAVAPAELGIGPIDSQLVRATADDEPLLYMAGATGGSALLSANDPGELLARIEDDYNDYYSLGYMSPRSRDGRHHRIEVRIPGRGFRIRHPTVYEGKSTELRMTERTLSALLLDATDNPLEVEVKLGPQERNGRRSLLPVFVTVPYDKLVLVPRGDSHEGRVSIYIVVGDEAGRMSPPRRIEVPVSVPDALLDETRGKFFGYGVKLEVRRGPGRLAIGVRDDVAAVSSTVNVPIEKS